MPRLLALDFDGVISDSAPEAFAVALRTYADLRPGSRLVPFAVALAGPCAPAIDRIRGCELYAGFLQHMPLGNRAEDYGAVLAALEVGAELPDQAAYDEFRAGQSSEWLRDYHRRFYRERAAMSRADPEGWLSLMAPYAPLLELLRRRRGDAILAIATAKDRHSVLKLLAAYGIEDLFRTERVLDKETGATKTVHLQHLRRETGVDFPDITFVDDKVNHLVRAAPLGVRCALAAWGFNGARERAEARARGIAICTLEEAESQLFP